MPLLDYLWKLLLLSSLSSTLIFGACFIVQPLLKKLSGQIFKAWSQAAVAVFLSSFVVFALLSLVMDRGLQIECFENFAKMHGPFAMTRLLAFAWVAVGCGLAVKDFLQYHRLKRRILNGIMSRQNDLHIVSDKMVPLTFGFFKYFVMIPQYLLHDSNLQYIVAHERVHVRNRDGVWNLLALVSLRLCWFHPLLYLFERRRRLAVEMATDEQVLRDHDFTVQAYCEALLQLLTQKSSAKTVGILGVSSDFAEMRDRIRNLNPSRAVRKTRHFKLAAAAFMLLGWSFAFERSWASIQMGPLKPTEELRCYQVQYEKVIENRLMFKNQTVTCEQQTQNLCEERK